MSDAGNDWVPVVDLLGKLVQRVERAGAELRVFASIPNPRVREIVRQQTRALFNAAAGLKAAAGAVGEPYLPWDDNFAQALPRRQQRSSQRNGVGLGGKGNGEA